MAQVLIQLMYYESPACQLLQWIMKAFLALTKAEIQYESNFKSV